MAVELPGNLCHYYDRAQGPLRNLSDLPDAAAEQVLEGLRRSGTGFASQRTSDYLRIRRELEARLRRLFIARGGRPIRQRPHYMILGSCPWVRSWYVDGCELCMPLSAFDPDRVSFTYGDSFPAMRLRDGRPHRGRVYLLSELTGLIATYGLPQEWNPDGAGGPERYIEAQVWDDAPLAAYLPEVRDHQSTVAPTSNAEPHNRGGVNQRRSRS